MNRSLSILKVLFGVLALLFGAVASTNAANPTAPIFDYEWIKGCPYTVGAQDQYPVLRITMHGNMDTATSPGLVVSGFNLALEIPQGVVDETLVPYTAGGGFRYANILPQTPKDANAAVVGVTPVRQLSDYRLITDAYPATIYPTLPLVERDERNAMRWDDANFIVEPLAGAPAGKIWIAITGVADRNITKSIGDIPSRTNDLTSAVATNPLGAAGSTTGTGERAAFLDIAFTINATPVIPLSKAFEFFQEPKLFANPQATDIMASDDHLPDPNAVAPTIGPLIPTDSGSFANTDGLSGGSDPQRLETCNQWAAANQTWELY